MPDNPVQHADCVRWPEWLTPEYSAIHTALENEIVKALEHCYASADAAGMNWTTEGWISCSASNIMGLLQRLGCPPPPVLPDQERLSVADVERHWLPDGDLDDEVACETCGGSGVVLIDGADDAN